MSVMSGADTIPSAAGMLTGNQDRQTQGNLDSEAASWKYKQGSSDSPLAVRTPSVEGVKGKVQTAVGMVTGDAGLQKEGNVKG